MTALKFYGKKSCITCQKAKAVLKAEGVSFEEIPIEAQPPARDILERLIEANGIKASLNSRSSIYKEKNLGKSLPDKATAIQLMLEDPNLIKRPVILNAKGNLYQGFDAETLQNFLK
jgi:arsenate reductase